MGQHQGKNSFPLATSTTVNNDSSNSNNITINMGLLAQQLPEEIWDQVLFFLDHKSLMNVRAASRGFSKKIGYKKVFETTKQLIPDHDNQNDLYWSKVLKISDKANVIGFHICVRSHDQGWSSQGKSETYTWGEMSFIDETSSKELTPRIRIFTGEPATKSFKKYQKFVHKGEIKDFDKLEQPCMALWACSCYGCWRCYIGGAVVHVVYLE